MKRTLKKVMTAAVALVLLAMILCFGCVELLAATVTTAGTDSLADHLVLYSSFDASNANDDSGNGHHGTPVGVQYTDGIKGKAVSITGQTNTGTTTAATVYVSYGDSAAIIPDTGDFTYSVFYRSTGSTAKWSIILSNKDYYTGKNRGFILDAKDDRGTWRANISNGVSGKNHYVYECYEPNVYDGQWHMMTVTHDRDGKMICYIDGAEVGSVDISASQGSVNPGLPLILGADGKLQYGIDNCELDELRIYDKALSAEEVSDLHGDTLGISPLERGLLLYSSFDASNANDDSGKGHNGTAVGVQYTDGIKGKAVSITGQTNTGTTTAATVYVNYGDSAAIIPDTGDFSYSIFYRSTGTTAEWSTILSNKDYGSGKNRGFALAGLDDHSSWRMNISDGSDNIARYGYTVPNIYDGQWHMMTATHDRDGSMYCYVDGVLIASRDISGSQGSVNAGLPLILGADGKLQYSINNCELDELRIYSRALAADEVEQLYTSTVPTKMIVEKELNQMLASVNGIAPGALYPQADIDRLVAAIENALDQLETSSDEQCLSLLVSCKAAYDSFIPGKKPLASFHLITDVHITYGEDNFKQTLQGMQGINADTNISLVIAGDNTNYGSAAQFNQFYTALDGNNPVTDNKTIVVMGNHDVRHPDGGSKWYSTPADYDANKSYWETAKGLYLTHNAPYMPNTDTVYYAKELGGYTFIALNTELDLKDAMYMSGTQLAWLEQTLATAYAKDPNKPIFIVNHQPLYDTHYGSSGWGTVFIDNYTEQESNELIKAVFAKYPNTIMLTGHSHNKFGTSVGVVRPYGAAVETPSLNLDNMIKGGGFEVQIYESSVVFRAINYITGEYLPQYDITIQTGENNVSTIYQNAQKMLADADKYCAESIADIRELSDALYSLITVSYANGTDNFYKAAQHAEINAAAQNLKNALANAGIHADGDDNDHLCDNCNQSVVGEVCQDEDKNHKCDECGTEMNMELHVDGDDTDHLCDYGCNEIADDGCYDMNTDVKCDECGEDFAHDCVGAVPCTSTTCKYCGQAFTPVEHDGEFACSTVCKYGCGTVITDAVAHDGEFECSTTCIYCHVENTVTDAVAHDGEFECSTTCIYCHVENAVTDAVAHDGEFDCSTTCIYCHVENAVADAVAHDGEFACSTVCEYGCGTEILDAVPCSGLHACSTKCQYCGEAVEPTEQHSFDNLCDLTCKICNEAIEALPHTGKFGCSTNCQWCGVAVEAAAHDGEFACSTVCKYGCGTVITDAVAHDGEYDCSTTCKYCGWENWVADAKNHTGAFNCSDTCQWCGVAIEAAAHDGKYACSTECKWCGAENAVTDAVAHEGEYACSTTCKYGCGATIHNAAEHKGEHACSTTCKVCGAAIAATSTDHTFESNGDNCDVCGEAKTESDSGMDTVVVIAIVIGVVAVIGVCVTVIVVKRKD